MESEMERIPLSGNPTGRTLVLTTLAMLGLGVVMVHSAVASVAEPGEWYARVDVRHTIFAVLAGVALLCLWRFDYRGLARGGIVPVVPALMLAVAIVCGVLVFVPGIGRSVGGAHRWIRIGPGRYSVGFQPSELIKLALVIFLAAWLSRKPPEEIRNFRKTFIPAVLLIAICVGLVITQDFGTGMLIGMTSAAVLLLAGVPLWQLTLLGGAAAGGAGLMVVCDPRRWARVAALIDPWALSDPGTYQPRNSLLAILNGGWFGQGPGRGIYKLGFLPEDSTDFIFSVFCEEWGFVGAVLLMGLIVLWIYFARRAAVRSSESFGRLLAGSLGFLIAVQAVLHIAVDLVVAPPTGMGLPFVSAGGTALVLMAGATALMVSVSSRPVERRRGEEAPCLSAST